MYINFILDRKSLEVLKDTSDSTVPRLLTPSKFQRKVVYVFVRKLPSKVNPKSKRVIVFIALGVALWFSNIKPSEAMGLSLSPSQIVRVHKPSYDDRSEIKIAKTVSPKLDKIRLIATNEMIPLIYINGRYSYINEQLLKKLRAGDLSANLTIVTIGVVIYVMCQLSGVDAFAIFNQISKWNAPTVDPGFRPTVTSTEIALVPTRAQEFNDMSLKFNEPKPNFIMTRDEALKLIEETYPGQVKITDNERISDWQATKKVYHASDFGVNPEDYGITKKQLRQINRVGLTKYVRLGNPLPPVELIKDYQTAVKVFCENSERLPSGTYSSRGDQKVHKSSFYYNDKTRKIVAFNIETQDLITAGKYSPRAFDLFLDTKHLGRL